MRGKVQVFSGKMLHTGITPPMRGKDGNHVVCTDGNGITPAYAGKSPQVQAGDP